MKLQKKQKISASLSDFNAELSVLGIFRIAEDAVTEFMGDLEIDGLTAKRVYNAVWVFAKTKIEFLKRVPWGDECSVTCFISKISIATLIIDVAIENGGELCAYSRTELCALDLATGKIRKVSTVGVDGTFETEPPLIDFAFTRIDADDLPEVNKVKIGFNNIDYAAHTNNVEYVGFMLNTYSVSDMKDHPIRETEIIFTNQSFDGDELTVHKGECDGKDIFVIRNGDKVIVKSEITRSAA